VTDLAARATAVPGPEAPGVSRASQVRVVADTARRHSGFEVVFPAAVLWGLMGCAAAFAISMVSERTRAPCSGCARPRSAALRF
jgi:hypothetical protein